MNGAFPHFGGYMYPSRPHDIARRIRERIEGSWAWEPGMDRYVEDIREVEEGSLPISELGAPDLEAYGQQSWSPLIPESYPGLFYDPSSGGLSTQKDIMKRLRWPKLGGVPYDYRPRRPRGFMGIEYPLRDIWGYGAVDDASFSAESYVDALAEREEGAGVATAPHDVRAHWLSDAIIRDENLAFDEKVDVLRWLSMNARIGTSYDQQVATRDIFHATLSDLEKGHEEQRTAQWVVMLGTLASVSITTVLLYLRLRDEEVLE